MMISRYSSERDRKQDRLQTIEHKVMEPSLKRGKFIAGLEGAHFNDYYFWNQKLRMPIPTHLVQGRDLHTDQSDFV